MIDATSVITLINQNYYPPDWRVYYGEYNPGCLFFWREPRSTTLVILPNGVVRWDAHYENDFYWLDFQNISSIQLAQETQLTDYDGYISSRTYCWLDVYCSDGTYLKWPIESHFSDAASVCKSIIAAYSFFGTKFR